MKYNSKYGMKHPPRKIAGGQLNVLKHTTHISNIRTYLKISYDSTTFFYS